MILFHFLQKIDIFILFGRTNKIKENERNIEITL